MEALAVTFWALKASFNLKLVKCNNDVKQHITNVECKAMKPVPEVVRLTSHGGKHGPAVNSAGGETRLRDRSASAGILCQK